MKKIITSIFLLSSFYLFSQDIFINDLNDESSSMEMVLQKYIQIPSISGHEKEAGEFLKTICENNGLHISSFGSEDSNYNFAASVFPLSSKKPNIIFLNHLDVVPESPTQNLKPYSGKIANGRIYGRGAIDNKGAALMQLYGILSSMKEAQQIDSPYNITFLSVSCEETQCEGGVSYVMENYKEELNPSVVFGEGPSELTSLLDGEFTYPIFGVSVIHKRALWLRLELEYDTSGHGSVTPQNYATKDMIKALERLTSKKPKTIYNEINTAFLKDLGAHHRGIKKLVLKNPRLFKPLVVPRLRKQPELYSLFSNTITLTNFFSNSNAVNKLSSKAGAHLDCRLLPETDEKQFLADLQKTLKNDSIKISVLKSLPKNQPTSTETVFYENLKLAIQKKYPKAITLNMMMPNINDLGYFRALDIPAYGTLPTYCTKEEVKAVHASNEHIKIKSLYDGAEVYADFLKRMMYSSQGVRSKK